MNMIIAFIAPFYLFFLFAIYCLKRNQGTKSISNIAHVLSKSFQRDR